jgi:hypothetical protein
VISCSSLAESVKLNSMPVHGWFSFSQDKRNSVAHYCAVNALKEPAELNDGSKLPIWKKKCRTACQSLKVLFCPRVLIRNYLCVACTKQHVLNCK